MLLHAAGVLSERRASADEVSSTPEEAQTKFMSVASAAREGSPEDRQVGLPVATVKSSMNKYHPL
jgi:hypothetical protein